MLSQQGKHLGFQWEVQEGFEVMQGLNSTELVSVPNPTADLVSAKPSGPARRRLLFLKPCRVCEALLLGSPAALVSKLVRQCRCLGSSPHSQNSPFSQNLYSTYSLDLHLLSSLK